MMKSLTLEIDQSTAATMLDSFVMAFEEDPDFKDGDIPSVCDFASSMGLSVEDALKLCVLAVSGEKARYWLSDPGFICEKK